MENIEYIELYVSNLPQTIHYYKSTFGFIPISQRFSSESSSVLIQLGGIKFVLTTPNSSQGKIAEYLFFHGDGIKNVAFKVENVVSQFENCLNNGCQAILEPTYFLEDDAKLQMAIVTGFGTTHHTFINYISQENHFLPGFKKITTTNNNVINLEENLSIIDHVAICVSEGNLSKWIDHYQKIYSFYPSYEEYITTARSGMNSKVVESINGKIRFVFVEPIKGKIPSQVEKFLEYNGSEGVQHIAFQTNNILKSVDKLHLSGVDFLTIPNNYYESQREKLQHDINDFEFKLLQEKSILVDKSDLGILYQIFTKPITSRPTLFFEIIQRNNCNGFGSGNIKALFQAVEKEQIAYEKLNHQGLMV